jgi:Yip1 domain
MSALPVVPAAPMDPVPAGLSEPERLMDTFIAPSKTFTDIRRNASWWAPWLIISMFSLLFIYAIQRQVSFEQVSKNQISHSKRADQFDKLPADQQEKQIQLSTKIIGFFAYGSPVMILFYFLITAAVLWGTFKMAGAETSFKQAYAIVMYASLPGVIGALLGTIAMFAGINPEGFDINNPVGTNLAYYLDPETTGKFLRSMASSLDVITIWSIVLMGIGFACTSKVKRSTAIVIVAAWYLVFKLASSGMAAFS